jgi:hypothetical protein
MKIQLTRTDKIELLKAIQKGELDTFKVQSLWQCLEGANAFFECMKEAFREDDEQETPPTPESVSRRESDEALS